MKLEGKEQIWKDYQKEIADDRYYYARSCIRQTFFPGSEWAYLDILRNRLGKDVMDDPRHTTCTGIGYHSDVVPAQTIMTVVARHFALMTEAGYENITPSCITSFGIYTEILETWAHHPEVEEQVREYLWKATGREFKKPRNLAHTSDIIYKFRGEIAARARHRLGCPHCYRVFQNDVRTFISSQIPVSERAGRTPADAQTARELSALQKKLEQAIADEHYEEACKIAHEIQQLRRDLETPEA